MAVQWRNTSERYGAVAQTLHWLVALGVVWQLGLGWYMGDLPNTPAKIALYNLHKSTGLTVLALVLVRLAWRSMNPAPPLPAGRRARAGCCD